MPIAGEETGLSLRRIAMATVLAVTAASAVAQDQVVYHISDAPAQALAGLRNAKNQLDSEPTTRITFVANAGGVDFLLPDAKDRHGNSYAVAVQELARRGVRFEVCEITLTSRKLAKDRFLPEASFTPSGVARITRLQMQQHAYIKP